ncbi:hypothetical protein XELAEV_18000277mg [Xenopus laevis]|uniref:REM-1 domain-containing protein n=1 Tax=Xenopus laevis TaxID=8355 RepID=A0A974GYW6_XENLA|nr:hypothetical protein XELAEV_18000277mg [Xenopus laevis]
MGAKVCGISCRHRHTETVDIIQSFEFLGPTVSMPKYLLGMKQELLINIQKEMRIAAGAEKLFSVTKDRKTRARVKELRNSCEKKVKDLYTSLHKLNKQIAQWREEENAPEAVQETTENAGDICVAFPKEDTEPEPEVISEPASDSSQHQQDDSAEEPVPEEEQPQVPSESDLPEAEEAEEAESVNVELQQPEREEET